MISKIFFWFVGTISVILLVACTTPVLLQPTPTETTQPSAILSEIITPNPTEFTQATLTPLDVKNTQIAINNVTREWRSGTATPTQTPTPLIWPTFTASPTPTPGFTIFFEKPDLSLSKWTMGCHGLSNLCGRANKANAVC